MDNPVNWQAEFVKASFIVGPLVFAGYLAYRKLVWTLGEYRPHLHEEEKGEPLTESGIRYPRQFNGRP